MEQVREKAYAKINLSLDITGVENGYHMLESVVTTVDIYDQITVTKRKKDKLVSIMMHGMGSEDIPFEGNNAVKAADAFIKKYQTCGVDIVIHKNIPMGAGMGGSSADVAGVLNAMKKLFCVDDEEGVKAIADSLGSDSGYMLYGGYAVMRGRGEKVELLENGLKADLVFLLPKTSVSTPLCYKTYDALGETIQPTTANVLKAIELGDKVLLGKSLSNSLQRPAESLNGDVKRAIEQLKEFDPLGVCMTGSGSAVYALCENDQFARYIESRYRGEYKVFVAKTYLPKR